MSDSQTADPDSVSGRVLLVGFQDQDNLGLRYLMSALQSAGHEVGIATFAADPDTIISRVRAFAPDIVGFSLIFQYMTLGFGDVIGALRKAGLGKPHITIGGHYPSFAYDKVLDAIPGLDSIIRFEGEQTLCELADRIVNRANWRDIVGLAYRLDDGKAVSNQLRDPVADLDTLAWPDRRDIDYESAEMATGSILASRGCPWDCSFCSIRPFYEAQGGKLRRLRQPSNVVDEMETLYVERGVSVFLFQDDDFLATGRRARIWASEIADELIERGLNRKIAFKISCRSDEVREDIMLKLKSGGLTHVYLGVESGDKTSLKNMNKMLEPERHLQAGRVLRSCGLSFDFGFMLMEPYSTFATVRNNIAFLREFVGDGWTVATFCRMLPYGGTPVRDRLIKENRLKGSEYEPDYDFLDERLNAFYAWVLMTFHHRNFTSEGLCQLLRTLAFQAHLEHPGARTFSPEQRSYVRFLVKRSNEAACYVLERALDCLEASDPGGTDNEYLAMLTSISKREETAILRCVEAMVDEVYGPSEAVDAGFDRSWTFNSGDREALGVGAA